MRYTDLHCDTAYELYKQKSSLKKNAFHINLNKAKKYEKYSQIFAVWSENDLDDDAAYAQFFKVREYFLKELKENNINLAKSGQEYKESIDSGKYTAMLAVEGGKLLNDDISRLDVLYKNDVRFLTLMWNGLSKIGGAFNTDDGLTDFGKRVVKKCDKLGIVTDVSHSSVKSFYDVLDITSKPFIATHSNSVEIMKHDRNLTDEQFRKIVEIGGIVGISMCRTHVAEDGKADIAACIKHIEHYLSLGGENNICFGFDFDGADVVDGIKDISDVVKLADEMRMLNYSEELIEKIFYKNADKFIIKRV